MAIKEKILNSDIEILIDGNKDKLSETQKQILLNVLKKESDLIKESEKALKEHFENADMEFISIEKHFEMKAISVQNEGFEIAFHEKEGQNYFFNIHFENNKYVAVSIDG